MSSAYNFIQIEVSDGVALLTFNRPEVRNALHLPMNLEIRAALGELAQRDDVKTVIFTGAGGKAFVSGADIAELRDRKGPVALEQHNALLCDAIENFPTPTIAAIQGWALGGGCEVALACDLRIGGVSAKLGQPEVSLGILPAAGGTWRLPQVV
ncbi:MAG: enoyl-CoA hydratase/isomerase family protein, partial [Myxococcota bacterium]|nr:enoyl-CoA hydratase/isomerase family protein [Myxococcota bacterium]